MLTNMETHTRVGQIAAQTAANVGSLVIQAESTEFQIKRINFPQRQSPRKSSFFQSSTYLSTRYSPSIFLVNSPMSDNRAATANKLAKEIMARPGNEGVDSAW